MAFDVSEKTLSSDADLPENLLVSLKKKEKKKLLRPQSKPGAIDEQVSKKH